MGKAINELDNAGALTDATLVPVGETDTLKKTTWATIKSTLETYFDTLYQSGAGERRHAFAAPYSYNGTATAGTADSASGWAITRIAVAADGTTTVATATGAWTDRASLTYT